MSVSQFENSFIQCFDDSLTDYCQHLLLAFPKLTIFGAADGHTAAAAAATTTCRTYHSKTNFYIIAFVAGSPSLEVRYHWRGQIGQTMPGIIFI